MSTPERVKQQIDAIVRYLVEVGLASDQNFGFRRDGPQGSVEITFPQAEHISIALKDRAYREIYLHLARERSFNVMLPDGALVQMMYAFSGGSLERHRLAFFPAPHLEEFQNNPDTYLEDEIYADVVAKNIVPFPLRFDFDGREGVHKLVDHPRSHLTLGQYENCRIPVSSAMSPHWFMSFVLRNFYHTASHRYADALPKLECTFAACIFPEERGVVHLQVPAG